MRRASLRHASLRRLALAFGFAFLAACGAEAPEGTAVPRASVAAPFPGGPPGAPLPGGPPRAPLPGGGAATRSPLPDLAADPETEALERALAEAGDDVQKYRDAARLAGDLVASRPGHVWGACLHAYALDRGGAPEAAIQAVEGLASDERAVCAWGLGGPPAETAALLRCNAVLRCLRREGRFRHHLPGGEPFHQSPTEGPSYDGPVECGGATVAPESCGPEFLVFERVAWTERSRERLARWSSGPPPTRESIPATIGVSAGMTVADVGAGTGFLTFPFAETVGPAGRVYAVDLDPTFTGLVEELAARAGVGNVVPVLSTPEDVSLPPASVDLAWVASIFQDVWMLDQSRGLSAETSTARPLLASVRRALKPGGALVIREHRPRPGVVDPINYDIDTIRAMVEATGLRFERRLGEYDRQYVDVYRAP